MFYWMVYALFAGAVSFKLASGPGFMVQHLPEFLFNWGWATIQFYLFYIFFYRFIEKQKYILYFIGSLVVSVLVALTFIFTFCIVFSIPFKFHLIDFLPPMAGTFIIGHTGSLLKGFIRWFEDIQRKQEMEKMLLQNELDALNAQLNPHFLFNTLNNIDSLIHSDANKASESLITLSEIMRYMLYDAKKSKIPVSKEIAHYQNIIRLQSLRIKDPSKVKFNTEVEADVEVAPLLFLPFLENAFKHASLDAPDSHITIDLKANREQIEFSCSNRYDQMDDTRKLKTGGIGFSNLRRRLKLLYPARFTLEINRENSYFSAHLTINP